MVLKNIAFEQRRIAEALDELLTAEKADPRLPDLHASIGVAWMRQRKWSNAERAFRKAIALDPHSAMAWQGLAFALLRLGRIEALMEAALTSVGYQHGSPRAHLSWARR